MTRLHGRRASLRREPFYGYIARCQPRSRRPSRFEAWQTLVAGVAFGPVVSVLIIVGGWLS